MRNETTTRRVAGVAALTAGLALGALAWAQNDVPPEAAAAMAAARNGGGEGKKDKPDFPPYDETIKEYEKVVSTADGQSLYTLWIKNKDNQLLAELPRNFEQQRLFIATTIAGGSPTAGIQFGDQYAYWKKMDKRLMLIQPNVAVRSNGDQESQRSRDMLFTDRVILDIPIVTMSPQGGPVIDMDALLIGQGDKFFGPGVFRGANKGLTEIVKAKAFPQNIEMAFCLPTADGTLTTLHYSWSVLPENTGYKPREADPRTGYFTTTFFDLGKPGEDIPWVRYVNRWKLERSDPSLHLSPPKEPIVFYIEHTTPLRYRRWVRDGILEWNKAYEKIGIVNAIEVFQQDARSGAHMDKDPEDVRYNFFRWNTNGVGFAIGPSRVDPRTGQILDADIVMNDGFIRSYARQWRGLIPQMAIEGFGPETLAWLNEHPQHDPRLLLAEPLEREQILAQRAQQAMMGGHAAFGGHPAAQGPSHMLGDNPFDGLAHRTSQVNGGCMNAAFKSLDLAFARFGFEAVHTMMGVMAETPDDKMIDGVPEEFIGELIKEVTAHEVGHTLGLRHNFKASTIRTIQEINAEDFRGQAQVGSVMDYNPVNINFNDGPAQGDWVTPVIGPYDYWVIEYGYTDKDLKDVLARASETDLIYGTDEDTWGPDPRARRFDYGKDPLDWADSRMRLVTDLRGKILDRAVQEGDGWWKARDAYQLLLGQHIGSVSVAANWIGGSTVSRERKGADSSRAPIENIPVQTQRRALKFVIDNAFNDSAFGLTPDLLARMTIDKWWDDGGVGQIFEDETWPVHDRISAIQRSAMTMILNPTTLRRVYDNEFRTPSTEDALTLPEVIFSVSDAIWSELDAKGGKSYTPRQPMVSSLRRNLQAAHIDRMIDLTMPSSSFGAAAIPVSNLSLYKLRELKEKMDGALKDSGRLDAYTLAHFTEASTRIGKALEAEYIYNLDDINVNLSFPGGMFGAPANQN